MANNRNYKNESAIKSTLVLSTIDFFIKLPNFFIILGAALYSNSSIIWVDLVNTFAMVIKNVIILSAIWMLTKKTTEYSYNTGKFETFYSVISSFVFLFSYLAVIFVCLNQLRFPQRPSENLFYAIFIKISNIIYDLSMYYIMQNNSKMSNSKLVNDQDSAIYEQLVFDIVAFVIICLSYFFRNNHYYWYVIPMSSLLLCVYFAYETLKSLYDKYKILTDRSLSESQQLLIMKVLAKHFDEYDTLLSISSHYDGVKPVIKLSFRMKEGTMDYQMSKFTIDLTKDINEYFENAQVDIIYNPIE